MAFAGMAGAGLKAIGDIQQGEAQAAVANYQGQVAKNNQIIETQNAEYATQAGEAQTYNVGLKERAQAGAITTGLAANNVDVNTGSARDVRVGQAGVGQLAEETTKANAGLVAYGYRAQAVNFGAQSQLLKAEAPADIMGGFLRAGGDILSGASSFGSGGFGGGGAVGGGLPIG